jgi:hypothetical protein
MAVLSRDKTLLIRRMAKAPETREALSTVNADIAKNNAMCALNVETV